MQSLQLFILSLYSNWFQFTNDWSCIFFTVFWDLSDSEKMDWFFFSKPFLSPSKSKPEWLTNHLTIPPLSLNPRNNSWLYFFFFLQTLQSKQQALSDFSFLNCKFYLSPQSSPTTTPPYLGSELLKCPPPPLSNLFNIIFLCNFLCAVLHRRKCFSSNF